MTAASATRVDRLLAELRSADLSDVDAHRAAFVALALAQGWSKARIGRYLGISRARVGQKVEKLRDYAMDRDRKTLGRTLAVADAVNQPEPSGPPIAFGVADWEQLDWARRMCDMLGR